MRGRQIGKILYESLFKAIRELGTKEVECVTSIKNETSIDFHKKIGFTIVPTDTIDESGMCYHPDYDGPGEHRILFNYQL